MYCVSSLHELHSRRLSYGRSSGKLTREEDCSGRFMQIIKAVFYRLGKAVNLANNPSNRKKNFTVHEASLCSIESIHPSWSKAKLRCRKFLPEWFSVSKAHIREAETRRQGTGQSHRNVILCGRKRNPFYGAASVRCGHTCCVLELNPPHAERKKDGESGKRDRERFLSS